MNNKLRPFLADTLWYGMTVRISLPQLKEYAELRSKQGFNAVQVVVGIPPEVGPLHKDAAGEGGPAWDLDGNFNNTYLDYCEERAKILNAAGLQIILYGAWGHQIKWIGKIKMKEWWDELIKRFEKYDVVFCLCGESNLWIGETDNLLPGKTTQDFKATHKIKKILQRFPFNRIPQSRLLKLLKNLKKTLSKKAASETLSQRRHDWSIIAEHVSGKTSFPLLIHTVPNETSLEAVNNPNVFSAVTTQTGHSLQSRNLHWQGPIAVLQNNPELKYINLEPWYEGILDNFFTADQLFSYWTSMLAGAYAYCYGAHGIWNVGDGNFLAQWGKQTFDEALNLETAALIGSSHKVFMESGAINFPYVELDVKNDQLISICRKNKEGRYIAFFPEYKHTSMFSDYEQLFDPLTGKFIATAEPSGPLVLIGKTHKYL